MARKAPKPANQIAIDAMFTPTTAPAVPAIAQAVAQWREADYPGATETTAILLHHWFQPDGHRLPNNLQFTYHAFQREAIETLIYLWEIARIRDRTTLLERYVRNLSAELRLPEHDDYARYAIKMATGSGKTKVMALAIVWQYLNAARSEGDDYAKTFLLIAPNVIVFERLRSDFEGGRIFQADPMIPKSVRIFWDLACVVRGDGERVADGLLFLTNVQQLYERSDNPNGNESAAMAEVMGAKPKPTLNEGRPLRDRIGQRIGPLLVLNDEAHHTHDEGNEWNTIIRNLHHARPLAAQLDFSATPRFSKGTLFPWTVFDYPLKRAIIDRVVKRPVKGVVSAEETKSDIASVRYQAFLVAGVNRWQEYVVQLAPLGKKPLLFIMLNDTKEADDVGDWLRTKYPTAFSSDKTLVIHTDNKGEVSKKDLDVARDLARRADRADNPVNAIVSVLMLREGWDVQNVTVVVGLRPYTSKANILPEQTIGRGLRLMFRGENSGYIERVDVIGNKTFLEFVADLEKIEDLKFDSFEVGKDKLTILTIAPQLERSAYDIGLPELSSALLRKNTLSDEILALDVLRFTNPPLPIKVGDSAEQTFRYEGQDLLTLEKLFQRNYTIPEPQTAGELIGYYAKRIASELKLPSQFAVLVPQVRRFFAEKAFGKTVDLNDSTIIKAMNRNVAMYVVINEFAKALKHALIEPAEPQLLKPTRPLAECPPFPWSEAGNRTVANASKTVFNLVACDNDFERRFALFLEGASEVAAFAKLPSQFGFAIVYVDNAANMRYYYPDFVVRCTDGTHYLLETKGADTVEVAFKDQAARRWCDHATALTGTPWAYLLVRQKDFTELQPADFSDLIML